MVFGPEGKNKDTHTHNLMTKRRRRVSIHRYHGYWAAVLFKCLHDVRQWSPSSPVWNQPLLFEGELQHLDASHQVLLQVLLPAALALQEGDLGLVATERRESNRSMNP